MLRGSEAAMSAWRGRKLARFARATRDAVCSAVLRVVILSEQCKLQGVGHRLVTHLLSPPLVAVPERVGLMTTNSEHFYPRFGFKKNGSQHLVLRRESG